MRIVSHKVVKKEIPGWLKDRFGDHFAQISTDTTLKLRSAVKDTARVLLKQVPWEIEELTKKFVNAPQGVTDRDHVFGYENDEGFIQGSIEYDPALREYIARYPEHWKVVQNVIGLRRGAGRHASAYGLANRPIQEIIPTVDIGGVRCTQYTAGSVEKTGVIKNDLLGVNSLNDISECIKLVQTNSPITIPKETKLGAVLVPGMRLVPFKGELWDVWDLPPDQAVFDDIVNGKVETVFQFHTAGARQWMEHFRGVKPNGFMVLDSIAEMAIFTALDRPGALDAFVEVDGEEHNMLVEYARRAKGQKPADTPKVFDLLVETHSVLTFQEQIQYIYQVVTDCTRAEAEKFRSDIAKKKKREVEKAYPIFMAAATAKYGVEEAQKAWDSIQTFSRYGLVKSHATAYSITGYACAFLKHHFPLEWWCAVLSNATKNDVNENFWKYCGHLVDLPDIKHSRSNFTIANDRIKAPLSLLNGIGETAHEQLCRYMPYTDIQDFCNKIQKHRESGATTTETIIEKVNKKTGETTKVKQIKKKYSHSALTRKVVYTLIISGVTDSLFTENMSVLEKLHKYEECLSLATEKKIEPVGEEYKSIGDLEKYQIRKEILPAYAAPLLPLIKDRPYFQNTASGLLYRNGNGAHKVLTNTQIADIMSKSSLPYAAVGVVPAYVLATRTFSYQSGKKTACSLTIDVDGERYEWVKWPDKFGNLPEQFNSKLEGALAMIQVRKWSPEKPFAIEDIDIISPKINLTKKGKEDDLDRTT